MYGNYSTFIIAE